MIDVDNVMGLREVSRMFGVTRSAVGNWQSRGIGFPDPAIALEGVELWDRNDVVAWGIQTRRLNEHGEASKRAGGRPRIHPVQS